MDGQSRAQGLLDGNYRLTAWEQDFLESITHWDGELTDAQEEKLNEIEERYER